MRDESEPAERATQQRSCSWQGLSPAPRALRLGCGFAGACAPASGSCGPLRGPQMNHAVSLVCVGVQGPQAGRLFHQDKEWRADVLLRRDLDAAHGVEERQLSQCSDACRTDDHAHVGVLGLDPQAKFLELSERGGFEGAQ